MIYGVDAMWAGWSHDGEPAELVRSLKYRNLTSAVTPIADRIVSCADPIPASTVDLVTWVPSSPSHRRRRGFDPAELLARAVARRLRLRARATLRRLDDEPQTTRSFRGRMSGPDLALRRCRVPQSVLVVDDVCTTGSTLRSAAAALRSGGAERICAAVATVAETGRASQSGHLYDVGAT